MKEAAAPAADESATRGVSPPGAPPTSPSTVTSTLRSKEPFSYAIAAISTKNKVKEYISQAYSKTRSYMTSVRITYLTPSRSGGTPCLTRWSWTSAMPVRGATGSGRPVSS